MEPLTINPLYLEIGGPALVAGVLLGALIAWILAQRKQQRLEMQIKRLHEKQFRVGDLVYVNDGKKNPLQPVYLRESYNGGMCYYVSERKDGRFDSFDLNGVETKHLLTDVPDTCKCCGSLLGE